MMLQGSDGWVTERVMQGDARRCKGFTFLLCVRVRAIPALRSVSLRNCANRRIPRAIAPLRRVLRAPHSAHYVKLSTAIEWICGLIALGIGETPWGGRGLRDGGGAPNHDCFPAGSKKMP